MEYEIYCDESRLDVFTSKNNHSNFMVIGGLWLMKEDREVFKKDIEAFRAKYSCFGEIKWNKVSTSKLEFYLNLIDYFFDKGEELRFRCIVIDKTKIDLALYHKSDAELSFYKFYYQLLHHWIMDFNTYSIYLDTKTNRVHDRLKTLHKCLISSHITSTIKKVQALPSDEVIFIQLVDLLSGAVSAKFNEDVKGKNKKLIIQKIEERLTHEVMPTSRDYSKFNIFKIDPGLSW